MLSDNPDKSPRIDTMDPNLEKAVQAQQRCSQLLLYAGMLCA